MVCREGGLENRQRLSKQMAEHTCELWGLAFLHTFGAMPKVCPRRAKKITYSLFFKRKNNIIFYMTTDTVTIIYKPIRNGYVRVNNQGKILISIPHTLKNNEWFKNALLEKGKKLLARHQKKNIYSDLRQRSYSNLWRDCSYNGFSPTTSNVQRQTCNVKRTQRNSPRIRWTNFTSL